MPELRAIFPACFGESRFVDVANDQFRGLAVISVERRLILAVPSGAAEAFPEWRWNQKRNCALIFRSCEGRW